MADELWRQFEKRIETESKVFGITCWKFPTEMRTIKKDGKSFQVPIKSMPDFAAGIFGLAAFFDAKSTQKDLWSLQDNVFRQDKSSNKLHQWESLEDAHNKGNIAGYLIWFTGLRQFSWASVETIKALVHNQTKTVSPDSPGVLSLPDDKPINLKVFFEKDLARRASIVGGMFGNS